MAYSVVSKKSGKTYHLHVREQKRKDGNVTKLYFFAGDIKDGASNVFAIGEVCAKTKPKNTIRNGAGWWAGLERRNGSSPKLLSVVRGCRRRLNARKHAAFGSRHPAGAHFLMSDGAVRFVSENIESKNGPNTGNVNKTPKVRGLYQRLGIRNDGAVTGEY